MQLSNLLKQQIQQLSTSFIKKLILGLFCLLVLVGLWIYSHKTQSKNRPEFYQKSGDIPELPVQPLEPRDVSEENLPASTVESAAELLNQMRTLNKQQNYSEVERLYTSLDVSGWTLDEYTRRERKTQNPADLNSEILLNIYAEYSYSLLKQKKFKECAMMFADVASPYCCYSVFNAEEMYLPQYKAFEFNTNACNEGWRKHYTDGRKRLQFKKCKSKGQGFQIRPGICYQIEPTSKPTATIAENSYENSVVKMFLLDQSKKKTNIVFDNPEKNIPDDLALFEESLGVEIYSDLDPDTYAVLISGDAQGWDGGTARSSFETFGLLNLKNKTFKIVDEKELSLH